MSENLDWWCMACRYENRKPDNDFTQELDFIQKVTDWIKSQ